MADHAATVGRLDTHPVAGSSSMLSTPVSSSEDSPGYKSPELSRNVPGLQKVLPEWVSLWRRRHLEKYLHIFYEKEYLDSPFEVLQKLGMLKDFTENQKIYIEKVKAYLQFDATFKEFDDEYPFYTEYYKPMLNKIAEKLEKEPEIDNKTYIVARLRVGEFIRELRRLLITIEGNRTKYVSIFEGNVTDILKPFTEMCCLEAKRCTSTADQTVWKNLRGVNVISRPNYRFCKSGIAATGSEKQDVVVSVIEVKKDTEELQMPPRKKLKSSSSETSSSSSSSTTPPSIIKHRPQKLTDDKPGIPQIEFDVGKRIIGQHAGELLLDLDRFRVAYEKFGSDRDLSMPGMIVHGTKVYFTLLVMSYSHRRKLIFNQELETEDKAVVYYSKALDVLVENDRNTLIENFMRLNNIL